MQVIQTEGRPGKLIYVQSTDQVWVEQTLDRQRQQQKHDDDTGDDRGDIVVIRQASEHLLHHVVHIDHQHQQLGHNNPLFTVCHLHRRQRRVCLSVCRLSVPRQISKTTRHKREIPPPLQELRVGEQELDVGFCTQSF